MTQLPIHYVDLRCFCYATEDPERVQMAMKTLLPEETEISKDTTRGHHGDRIIVFSVRVENAAEIRHVFARLGDASGIESIVTELNERVTEDTELFFRLDKQAAFNETLKLGDGITVRAKIEAYPAKRPKAIKNARTALTEAAEL